jgi:hypothetical protein
MTPAPVLANGPSPGEVEAAVRSVLVDMLGRATRPPNGALPGQEIFSGRLLSLRSAETIATGSRVVTVAAGTVITPLAADYLKRLGVEIRIASRAEVERLRPPGEWAFAVESLTNPGMIEALKRGWLEGNESWEALEASLEAAAQWVAQRDSRGALVLSDESAVAVYQASQFAGVRAAAVSETEAVRRAKRSLGVNLLVIEPAGKPIGLIRQLGAAFRRGGAPVVPSWLR